MCWMSQSRFRRDEKALFLFDEFVASKSFSRANPLLGHGLSTLVEHAAVYFRVALANGTLSSSIAGSSVSGMRRLVLISMSVRGSFQVLWRSHRSWQFCGCAGCRRCGIRAFGASQFSRSSETCRSTRLTLARHFHSWTS